MIRYKAKVEHFFTPDKKDSAKAPILMLMRGKEGKFINWQGKQTKKVDSIQNYRIDILMSGKMKNVQYFKGLFSSSYQ